MKPLYKIYVFSRAEVSPIKIEDVERILYVHQCPYCDQDFETENPSQIYCRDSHRVMFCQKGIANAAGYHRR